jgi:hypothetical protein
MLSCAALGSSPVTEPEVVTRRPSKIDAEPSPAPPVHAGRRPAEAVETGGNPARYRLALGGVCAHGTSARVTCMPWPFSRQRAQCLFSLFSLFIREIFDSAGRLCKLARR